MFAAQKRSREAQGGQNTCAFFYLVIYRYLDIWIHIYVYIYIRISFDAGVCGCFADTVQIQTPRGMFFMLRFEMDQKGCPKEPTWSQKGAERTGSQSEPRNLQKLTYGTGSKKVAKKGAFPGTKLEPFWYFFFKIASPKSSTREVDAKGMPQWM